MLLLTPRDAYQLDLTTPGSSPCSAMFRKQIRQIPNLRRKARGRPHRGQRLYFLTLNLGVRFAFAINDFFAKVVSFFSLLPKGHSHQAQEGSCLIVVSSRGDDGDVQTLDLIDLVVVDLRENDVFLDSQGVVPSTVQGLG